MKHTEKELLLRVAKGDEKAFTQLLAETSGLLHSFVLRHTQSKELAEEIVQDVFTHIWQTRADLTEIKNFRAYLYVISRNRVINEIKKMIRDRKHHREWVDTEPGLVMPEDTTITEELYGLVDAAVENLPLRQKEAWILHRREGKTYNQVATEMKISRETVKTYLQHATHSITKYISGHPDL